MVTKEEMAQKLNDLEETDSEFYDDVYKEHFKKWWWITIKDHVFEPSPVDHYFIGENEGFPPSKEFKLKNTRFEFNNGKPELYFKGTLIMGRMELTVSKGIFQPSRNELIMFKRSVKMEQRKYHRT